MRTPGLSPKEGIMSMRLARAIAIIELTLLGWIAPPGWAQTGLVEPRAGTWKTHVLASGSELRLPPPPDAAATQAEMGELRALVGQRTPAALAQINYWDAGSPGYRWNEIAMSKGLRRIGKIGAHGNYRMMALLNVAIYDATIAAWESKYAHNRRRPGEIDPTLTTALPSPRSPSYPSAHAAAAGAASVVLAYVMPDDAQLFAAKAEEAARSRVLAGAEFPSDVKVGLALGRAVGERAVARARNDGFDASWTGTVPAEPGKWTGTNPNFPMAGTWKTWIARWDGKSSIPDPPAWNGPEMAKAVAEMKAFKPTGQPNATFWPDDPAGRPAPDQGPKATDQIAYHYAKLNHLLWAPQLSQKIFEYRWDQNPPRAARAYALTSIASYDTLVACWGTRYLYWYPRPFQIDPSITPTFTTPNQPAYPSGHSCIEGATSRVLEYLFPPDAAAIRSRAEELAASRWWSRIHWHWDNQNGLALGRGVGDTVIGWAKADGSN
jgi:membrane-associated phospholipid phosphatase